MPKPQLMDAGTLARSLRLRRIDSQLLSWRVRKGGGGVGGGGGGWGLQRLQQIRWLACLSKEKPVS